MPEESKTFLVECAACGKDFRVRFPLADPDAEGESEKVVECLYCDEKVKVTLPRKYIREEHLLRGLPSKRLEQ